MEKKPKRLCILHTKSKNVTTGRQRKLKNKNPTDHQGNADSECSQAIELFQRYA